MVQKCPVAYPMWPIAVETTFTRSHISDASWHAWLLSGEDSKAT